MRKKKKLTREKGLEKHILATRADNLMRSKPEIPNYDKLALRPGAEDYKDKPSITGETAVTEKNETLKYTKAFLQYGLPNLRDK